MPLGRYRLFIYSLERHSNEIPLKHLRHAREETQAGGLMQDEHEPDNLYVAASHDVAFV